MDRQAEKKPAEVCEDTKQAGDIRSRWAWVEPSVWTDRMLIALEEGVKGGRWFSLVDKVYRAGNLMSAFTEVKANRGSAGVDHVTVQEFERDLVANIDKLAEELKADEYHPRAIRRAWIPKAGSKEKRPLGIPTVRDRIAQAAIRHVIEPIFEKDFAEQSYGFRPNRGCKDALRRVDELLKSGYHWVVDADLRKYFDTIPHEKLMGRVNEKVADGRVLGWIKKYLKQEIMETAETWTPEEGTPQGAVLSPLLSNIYLNPLDHQMAAKGHEMIRYADDFVIMCRSEQEAQEALKEVQGWVEETGLTLHPEKTRIVDASKPGGFDFLGYHFERGYRWPREKSMTKLKDTIRSKTKRCNGHSLEEIIEDVNRTTQGWFGYFKHSHKTTFRPIDGWIRMRLRSILRQRIRLKGRGRGADHQRWPNSFFAAKGLFSMTAAQAAICQSSRR